jgi:hypothetical protein
MFTQRFDTKLKALPTANKKDGNTKSVGVNPFQSACFNGQNVVAPFPEVFTMIIKQIVNPRKTSKAVKRDAMVLVEVVDVIFLEFVQVN